MSSSSSSSSSSSWSSSSASEAASSAIRRRKSHHRSDRRRRRRILRDSSSLRIAEAFRALHDARNATAWAGRSSKLAGQRERRVDEALAPLLEVRLMGGKPARVAMALYRLHCCRADEEDGGRKMDVYAGLTVEDARSVVDSTAEAELREGREDELGAWTVQVCRCERALAVLSEVCDFEQRGFCAMASPGLRSLVERNRPKKHEQDSDPTAPTNGDSDNWYQRAIGWLRECVDGATTGKSVGAAPGNPSQPIAETALAVLQGLTRRDSLALLRSAAEDGFAPVEWFLAELLLAGDSTDLGEGLRLLESSARKRFAEAQFQFARVKAKGLYGCKRDDSAALAWYTDAADAGHVQALHQLKRERTQFCIVT